MTHKATERRRSEGAPPISLKASAAPQPVNGRDTNGSEYRPLAPHNLEAEQALLGAILIDNRVHGRVADFVHTVDFYDPLHQQIYETAAKLIEDGKRADPITLQPFFVDAAAYLGTLVVNSTGIMNAREYARTVRDLSTRRRLILISEDMQRVAYEAPVNFPPGQQIAEHLGRLTALDSGGSRLKAISVASFAERPVPPREWHAKGLIPARNTTLLGGDGGTGKSLLAAQLAVATVLGRSWLGVDVKRGPVVYLSAEDDEDEMHRRFDDIARHQDVSLGRLQDLHLHCLAGQNSLLAIVNERGIIQATDLWAEFRRFVIHTKPALVVYDPLADLFGGHENIRTQAQQFVSQLRGLALETSSTALLLAHPSLSGMASGTGTSGSTGWNNSVRSRLYFERIKENGVEVDPDVRVLKTMKSNYGPTGGTIKLRWHDGVFTTGDNPNAAATSTAKDLTAEAIFLELLATYTATGRRASANRSPTYAPTMFSSEDRGKPIGKKALERAMGRLLEAGRIRSVEFGPASKRRERLEVV